MKIAIVTAEFNSEITLAMEAIAQRTVKLLGGTTLPPERVPGCFEIPLAVKKQLSKKDVDGVITLGAIIKGGTGHDELIASAIAPALLSLSLAYNKPVAIGILGPKITWRQAKSRASGYAKRAAQAAVKMIGH
ncbi:MAG: 6,7-dimethyl-8-ribityllumazine synthase [Candidatus Micrarchaeota archaeon]